MKKALTTAALALALACGVQTTASAKMFKHHHHSKEHNEAVKKCQDDYTSAVHDAKGKKGKERSDALAAARKARADCRRAAPK